LFKAIITGFLTFWSIFSGCPYSNKNCSECPSFKYSFDKIGHIPSLIKESSGLVLIDDLFLTQGDSGNEPTLFGFKYPFNTDSLQGLMPIPEAKNTDWEDLAFDGDSIIFIGDFGNNGNQRKDLKIIRYNMETMRSEVIEFEYQNQDYFPPQKRKNQNFDCEAMFWYKSQLYIFSKNKKSKYVNVYRLSDSNPLQKLTPIESIKLKHTQVTSADISPDQNEIALLAYGKVLFFSIIEDDTGKLSFRPKSCKRVGRSGQAEAIIYLDNKNLMITNEKGKVFLISRKYQKRKDTLEKSELYFPE